jgi:nuclear pore complex protein Nup153
MLTLSFHSVTFTGSEPIKKNDVKINNDIKPITTMDFGSKFQTPVGNWSCPTCMVNNKPEVSKCPCCETLKPTDNLKNSTDNKNYKHLNQSSSSVIKPPESSNSTTQPPLSSLFTMPAGKWECPSCMVNNNNDLNKCPCCETAKPGIVADKASTTTLENKVGDMKQYFLQFCI